MRNSEKIVISSEDSGGKLVWKNKAFKCALGSSGVSKDKHEGDGATPAGCFLIREIYYRADRIEKPDTTFPAQELAKDDGWCDESQDPNYNKHVKLPYPASAEKLWRDDNLYDIIVVLGYNDQPVIPGRGSCIFMHIARPAYTPTAGCVALSKEDLLEILKEVHRSTPVCI